MNEAAPCEGDIIECAILKGDFSKSLTFYNLIFEVHTSNESSIDVIVLIENRLEESVS
jgi:hypothetical protein